MNAVRRFSLLATTGLLCIAVMLGWVSARPSISADAASQLAASVAYFDSTIVLARNARPTGSRGDALVVSLGYLERERLGLGSPFRLVDEALNDPRLDSASSVRTAWTLLARLRRGDAYAIDPVVLDGIGPWTRDGRGATGRAHLALIERAIARASSPQAGELAVRLAYSIAGSRGILSSSAPGAAIEVAALVRDRALAVADLRELLAEAAQRHEDALDILTARRAARAFAVERPTLLPLTAAQRIEAMNEAIALVPAIEALDGVPSDSLGAMSMPVLGPAFAARLSTLGARRPTIAQVAVTVKGRPQAGLSATNEETLVGSFAARATSSDSSRRAAVRAVLASAVSLRPYNQASPWFAGDPSPSEADITSEFGLASVQFARGVPATWRPYYLRELSTTLRDMQAVLPALSLAGLNVRFGTSELPDSALAMHDPRSRTLELTIGSSAGTLAHELSHDLDWQSGRRLFAVAGGYSSDRAIRERRGALASSMRGLAEARLLRPLPQTGDASRMPDRPAELFARGSDWFVATALALGGRTNGFLTSIQDAAIVGYAAGAPTAVGSAGVSALVSAVDQMTYVTDSAQSGFEAMWSDPSTIDPLLLVRRVLATPIGRVVVSTRDDGLGLRAVRPPLCVSTATEESRARARLVSLTIESRARGIAARRARYRFGARPDWGNALLGVGPWDPHGADLVVAAIESAIVSELRSAPADQGVVPTVPLGFQCGTRNQ